MFKKNEFVVQILDVMGTESATVKRVTSVKKDVVRVADLRGNDSSLTFDNRTGHEIDRALPGCSARIIMFDGGEAEELGLE